MFDYLTRIYTDLLAQVRRRRWSSCPLYCCVAYLAFVLRIPPENETRLRGTNAGEPAFAGDAEATREITPRESGNGQHLSPRPAPPHAVSAGCIENSRTEQAQAYIREVCAEIESQKVRVLRKRDGEPDPVGALPDGRRSSVPLRAGGGAPFYPSGGDGSVRAAVTRWKTPLHARRLESDG